MNASDPTSLSHEPMPRRRWRWLAFSALLYVSAVLMVMALGYRKYRALAFHSRDYAYYAQFAARLSDARLSDRFSLQPFGHSFLGYADVDGRGGLHRGIHFEPLKYVHSLVYGLAPSPLALVFLHGLLFYLPLLYLPRAMPLADPSQRRFLIALALCWALCPSGMQAALYDLRPLSLMAPALFVLIIAVVYDRPRWEVAAAACLVLFVREEGLVFAACGAAMLWARNLLRGRVWHRGLGLQAALWVGWALLVWGYYAWADLRWSPHARSVPDYLFTFLGFPLWIQFVVVAPVATMAIGMYRNRKAPEARSVLCVLAYLVVLVLLALNLPGMVRNLHTPGFYSQIVVGQRWSLYSTALILLPVVLRRSLRPASMRRGSEIVLWAFVAVFAALNLFAIRGCLGHMREWGDRMQQTELVFRYREEMDPYGSGVMTGYEAYQAFATFERVTCYKRLPVWRMGGIVGSVRSTWDLPPDARRLGRIFRNETEWLVLSPAEVEELRKVLEEAGVEWDARRIDGNQAFEVYRREAGAPGSN